MKFFLSSLAGAVLVLALGANPANSSLTGPALDAGSVIARMSERNPTVRSYRARIHVDVRMLSFPYLAPKLDGTSYFKRPDWYVVVFDSVPSYARGFSRLFDDVGSPQAWEKNENITVDRTTWLNGRPTIVLRLTKKIHSDILDHTLAYVDLPSYALVQMEWYYTNGGRIAMTQQYRAQGNYWVLARQHATIAIPYVHAVADASYGPYQINVPIASDGEASP